MTASSPVTMEDLVNGLKFTDQREGEWGVVLQGENYFIDDGEDSFNKVSLSSDGLTISFSGEFGSGGPTFTGFTFSE